jgi:hypothetical protein
VPVEIIDADRWSNIPVKGTASGIPTKLFVEGSNPLETLNFWPLPNVASSAVLWSWKPLTQFASVNSTVTVPPGYLRALRYNLALELSAEYGIQPAVGVAAGALESKENIKRHNIVSPLMSVDDALLSGSGGFNYLTGGSK